MKPWQTGLCAAVLGFGCGGDDPGVMVVPGGAGTSGGSGLGYYPTVDGALWSYDHTGGSTPWTENVSMTATVDGFELTDTAGPSGLNSVSTLSRLGTRVLRTHKDVFASTTLVELVDYDPGFTRFDEAWLQHTAGFPEQLGYTRIATDGQGHPISNEQRSHTYLIVELPSPVVVPAGSFTDCIQIRRSRMPPSNPVGEGDQKLFWFCDGVGKVKEIDEIVLKMEVLVLCTVPGGRCP